ncbi:MAG: phenylacetic acid degradation operon negative regulatory protein [Parcubacteria group bacterium LiPW_39]|nr:MAG: phenylacetic acid degradation operon negative regulatory protein [Parcubacteria group bacterium LiPW_39]
MKNLFLAIDKILATGQLVFSRNSLLTKLDKLAALDGASRRYLSQAIKRSANRDLIEIEEKKGRIFYRVTPAGIKCINRYKFKELKITDKKWDGFWRVMVFDIPESKRVGRDLMRRKLKHLGFYSLQKSVFVCPFKCEKELTILGDFYNISEYLEVFLTRSVTQKDEKLRKFFGL